MNSLTGGPDEETEIVAQGDLKHIMDLSLVLASQKIPHRILCENSSYVIKVNDSQSIDSKALINIYLKENKNWIIKLESLEDIKILLSPILILIVPSILFFMQFFNVFNTTLMTYQGRSDAIKIFNGEWWRVFTALTLHADIQHYFSNLVSGYFILNLLFNRMNLGLSILLVTLSAGAANFLTAAVSASGHLSLGFSTAVFSALGILSSVQVCKNLAGSPVSRNTWAPVIAAFFMVVLLGLGEGSDIKAHFLGFLTGFASGIAFYGVNKKTEPRSIQIVLLVIVYCIFGISWNLALR